MPSFWVQQWHQFIFVLANNGATVFLGTLIVAVLGLGPIGKAIARRLSSKSAPAFPAPDPSLVEMRATLEEVLERLDFSERVLSELRGRPSDVGPAQIQARKPRAITPV